MPSSACDWSSDVCSSDRSEEHTSELQSRSDLVCRLLLEKKKNKNVHQHTCKENSSARTHLAASDKRRPNTIHKSTRISLWLTNSERPRCTPCVSSVRCRI